MINIFLWSLIIYSVFFSLRLYLKHSFCKWPHQEKRKPLFATGNLLVYYVSVIFVFLVAISEGDIEAKRLAISQDYSLPWCFFLGFIANCVWQVIYKYSFDHLPLFNSTISNYRTFRSIVAKSRLQKMAIISLIVLFNPLHEELLYRGFLVYNLSCALNGVSLPIAIGYLVFVSLHLYQGISSVLPQSLNYALFIGLLFSPMGLIGAIGFHLGGDLFPFMSMKATIREYRAMYKKRNVAAVLSKEP